MYVLDIEGVAHVCGIKADVVIAVGVNGKLCGGKFAETVLQQLGLLADGLRLCSSGNILSYSDFEVGIVLRAGGLGFVAHQVAGAGGEFHSGGNQPVVALAGALEVGRAVVESKFVGIVIRVEHGPFGKLLAGVDGEVGFESAGACFVVEVHEHLGGEGGLGGVNGGGHRHGNLAGGGFGGDYHGGFFAGEAVVGGGHHGAVHGHGSGERGGDVGVVNVAFGVEPLHFKRAGGLVGHHGHGVDRLGLLRVGGRHAQALERHDAVGGRRGVVQSHVDDGLRGVEVDVAIASDLAGIKIVSFADQLLRHRGDRRLATEVELDGLRRKATAQCHGILQQEIRAAIQRNRRRKQPVVAGCGCGIT